MNVRASLGAASALAVLFTALSIANGARAFDESKYPEFSGIWRKPIGIGNQWDQTKPLGRAQEPPFTPEYQAIFEASLADQKAGGQGNDAPSRCVPFAMPRVMTVVFDMEIVVTPSTTYMLFAHSMPRRIVTDRGDWPNEIEPTFLGYSIGKWIDTDGDGRYDVLEIETRGLKGPRTLDASGLPLHPDNQTIIKERIYLDAANRNRLHDQITTIDNAYTRPWTIVRDYNREQKPLWPETNCSAENHYVFLKKESYFVSVDGYLMPTRKEQPAPDLRNFK
jgi:hypothetical protein